ncbi:MAG: MgtC/SapB family protein [Planctomycetota bacterium]
MQYTLDPDLLEKTVVSVFIGALMGMQREYRQKEKGHLEFAGFRTFALISLLGGVATFLSVRFTPATIHVVFAILGLLVACAYTVTTIARQEMAGMTTEVSALLAFLLGALVWYPTEASRARYLAADPAPLAIMLAVVITGILSLKRFTLAFIKSIDEHEIMSTLKFAIVACVIWPVLPDQAVTSFEINPRKVWLFVVLVSGLSFVSYVLIRLIGPDRGIGVTGFLGGLISSTAVTGSLAPRSGEMQTRVPLLAGAILLAWGTMFLRILILAWTVNPAVMRSLIAINVCAAVPGLALAALWLWHSRDAPSGAAPPEFQNPFHLMPAIKFGAVVLIVLVVSRYTQQLLGNRGLYITSVLAGLTDVDAVTLSAAEMAKRDQIGGEVATVAIELAAATNTIVKQVLAGIVGSRALALRLAAGAGLMLAGAAVAWLLG